MENWRGFTRYNFDARLDPRDMRDTFLVPFEACAKANAVAMMCSYNGVNGAPSCVNKDLLQNTLRGTLAFKGFVSPIAQPSIASLATGPTALPTPPADRRPQPWPSRPAQT
ncbi:hypothetical protein ABPG75_008223 [Micractinium tetrahymenae]